MPTDAVIQAVFVDRYEPGLAGPAGRDRPRLSEGPLATQRLVVGASAQPLSSLEAR